MDFSQEWTRFALDAEVEEFGTGRIASAHNIALQNYLHMSSTLRGCRDMLNEAQKQFRVLGDTGHANGCKMHAEEATRLIDRA